MAQHSTKQASVGNLLDNIDLNGFGPVTPSDTVDIPLVASQAVVGLYAAGAGTIAVQMWGGSTATLTVAAGSYSLVGAKRVLATGTTATGIAPVYTPF